MILLTIREWVGSNTRKPTVPPQEISVKIISMVSSLELGKALLRIAEYTADYNAKGYVACELSLIGYAEIPDLTDDEIRACGLEKVEDLKA